MSSVSGHCGRPPFVGMVQWLLWREKGADDFFTDINGEKADNIYLQMHLKNMASVKFDIVLVSLYPDPTYSPLASVVVVAYSNG